jgi:hypothetical protein
MAHSSENSRLADIKVLKGRRFYPLPDSIIFLYLLVISRQYLWGLGGSSLKNAVAWSISIIIATGLL